MCTIGDRDLRLMRFPIQRDELAYTVCCQQYCHEIIGMQIEVLRVSLDIMVPDGVQLSQASRDDFLAHAAHDREAAAIMVEKSVLRFAVNPAV